MAKSKIYLASLLVLIPATLSFFSSRAITEEIFKHLGKDGKIYYSSKPLVANDKPIELPKIMRGEVKLTTFKRETCAKHGGEDCSQGADSDGSVVCRDGYKNASTRFSFVCSTPKLELSEVTDLVDGGKGSGFRVIIRNTKGVDASKPKVLYKPNGEGMNIQLKGPDSIEGYGIGEFELPTPGDHESRALGNDEMRARPDLSNLDISCANCP